MVLVFKEKNILLIWILQLLRCPQQLQCRHPRQRQPWEPPALLPFPLLLPSLLPGLLPLPLFTFLFLLLMALHRQLQLPLHRKKWSVQLTQVPMLGKGFQTCLYIGYFELKTYFPMEKKVYVVFRPIHRKYLIHRVAKT